MITLRKKIRVGALKFGIRLATKEELPDLGDLDGFTDFDAGEIVVSSSINIERKQKILIHELLHACFEDAGITELLKTVSEKGFKGDLEEQIVTSISSPVTSVVEQLAGLEWRQHGSRKKKD